MVKRDWKWFTCANPKSDCAERRQRKNQPSSSRIVCNKNGELLILVELDKMMSEEWQDLENI